MLKRSVLLITTTAFVLAFSAAGMSNARTTLDRTIVDSNGDNVLEYGPGDIDAGGGTLHYEREELGTANTNRRRTRQRLFTFAQMTDFQTLDEESPLRVEDTDDINGWGLGDNVFGSAYRPQESLGLQTTNSAVKSINRVMSKQSKRRPELVFLTGDNTDNMHENETEWYIDVLDGGQIDPDSGDRTYDPGWECFPTFYPDRVYQGVRDGGDGGWYEPDGDNLPDKSEGDGYSSNDSENFAEVGRHIASRNFPGLFEKAQRPFAATGLNVPWLTVFGNHDSLVWGNVPKSTLNPVYLRSNEGMATGCLKDVNGNFPDLDWVEPDLKRHLLTQNEWISKHFDSPSSPGPVGHGFTSRSGPGYYTYELTDGLRIIGLDSVNHEGLSNGTIRDQQFNWLSNQLTLASNRGEKVIVIAHHSLRTMNNMDAIGWEDQHCGLIDSADSPQPGAHQCNDLNPATNESLEALFYRKRNVVAFIAGHEHKNNIEPRREQGGPGRFWEITTVSEIDWPQQSSLFEIYDNRDGTWSIFRTLVDHNAAPDPGANPDLNDPDALASISRELSFNDPQGKTTEYGTDRRGDREDRNVELLLGGFNKAPRCDDTSSYDLSGVQQVFRVPCDDDDPDDHPNNLTYEIVGNPPSGSVGNFSMSPMGFVTYDPAPGYTGTFRFSFKACDDGTPTPRSQCSDPATATVTVMEEQNRSPVCWDSSYAVPPVGGMIQIFNLTCVDSDGPPPLTYEIVTDPPTEIDTLFIAGSNGAIYYAPELGDPSPFTFTFRACDGGSPSLCSANATATVTVAGNRRGGSRDGGDDDSGGSGDKRGGGKGAHGGGKKQPPKGKHGGTKGSGVGLRI